jgi:hypothetical protein
MGFRRFFCGALLCGGLLCTGALAADDGGKGHTFGDGGVRIIAPAGPRPPGFDGGTEVGWTGTESCAERRSARGLS